MTPVSNEPLEHLEMARDLIREAKGADGPNGGYVTDHLDAAENWLDKVEVALRSQSPEPSSSEVRVPRNLDRATLESLASHIGYTVEETAELYDEILDRLSTLSPTVSQPGTGEEVARLTRERDEAARIARDLTKALVDLTPGGSEYFTRCTMLDTYYADIEQCTRVIRERFESGHQAKIDRVDERRRAEAAEARLSAVEGALKPFAFNGLRVDLERFDGETKIEVHFPRTGPSKAIPTSWVYVEDVLAAREALTTITGGDDER